MGMVVSVPLRGYGFEIRLKGGLYRRIYQVSVPLRGYGFEILPAVARRSGVVRVSVPLRGYGFEIVVLLFWLMTSGKVVSVPLRGYGFEIISELEHVYCVKNCFRPLAGIWF